MKKISVLIPAFKISFIEEAINSVLSQTYHHFELIIVNDSSPYDIDNIIQKYNDQRISYYVNDVNCGAKNVVDNWNICLSKCSGDYLMCIGDDDKLKNNCLYDLAQLIEKYPNVDLFHSRTEIIDEKSTLIKKLPQQPEWESVYSFINTFHDSGLGSYLFKTNSLKNKGGFYKLPYGWSSDVVSAIVAACSHGVVHTPETGFQYRGSNQTISYDIKSIEDKIQANLDATSFLIQQISLLPPSNTEEQEAKRNSLKNLSNRMRIKNLDLIEFDIRKDPCHRFFFWAFNCRKYSIPLTRCFYCALKAMKYRYWKN